MILVLTKAPLPALLAVAGLHHHLIRQGTRAQASIILESGEPREVMHYALLLGYGVDLINPYLALESARHLCHEGTLAVDDPARATANFLKANLGGVIKTMSKMGISTVASYRGAQIFEAIGLNKSVIDEYFTATSSRVEGIGLPAIASDARERHVSAFAPRDDEKASPRPWGRVSVES